MRLRLLVILLAFVAMVAVPSEAVLADAVGSVVGQVASCVEPSGLLRDGPGATDEASQCEGVQPSGAALVVVAVLTGSALVCTCSRTPGTMANGQRWRLIDAVVRRGASWRAPPVSL